MARTHNPSQQWSSRGILPGQAPAIKDGLDPTERRLNRAPSRSPSYYSVLFFTRVSLIANGYFLCLILSCSGLVISTMQVTDWKDSLQSPKDLIVC